MEASEVAIAESIVSFLLESGDGFVHASALTGKLGLEPAALLHHVEALRRRGYVIEAQPARGYRLFEVPDRLGELELAPFLSTRELGRRVTTFDALLSTNAKAFELASAGAEHGEVIIAEAQTDGRGRRGRRWLTVPGKGLAMSVILRPDVPPERASEATLVASVALADVLREAGVQVGIKWPNDLLVDGRKVAGILTELATDGPSVDFLVLGIGVNLNADAPDFPADLAESATSVFLARGERVPRALFTAALLASLEARMDLWLEEGFAPIRAAWRARALTLGQRVLVLEGASERVGRAEDIDETGALLLRTSAGLERVLSGDVEHLRPAP